MFLNIIGNWVSCSVQIKLFLTGARFHINIPYVQYNLKNLWKHKFVATIKEIRSFLITPVYFKVVHSLLDLPLLSASICIHQTALLVQAGIRVPVLLSARQLLEADANHKSVYSHLMRSQALAGQTDLLLKR